MNDDNAEEWQGKNILEINASSDIAGGSDTVKSVIDKLRPVIGGSPDMQITEKDNMTLFVSGRIMQENLLFFADHYICLPCWIQVLVYDNTPEQFVNKVASFGLVRIGKNVKS